MRSFRNLYYTILPYSILYYPIEYRCTPSRVLFRSYPRSPLFAANPIMTAAFVLPQLSAALVPVETNPNAVPRPPSQGYAVPRTFIPPRPSRPVTPISQVGIRTDSANGNISVALDRPPILADLLVRNSDESMRIYTMRVRVTEALYYYTEQRLNLNTVVAAGHAFMAKLRYGVAYSPEYEDVLANILEPALANARRERGLSPFTWAPASSVSSDMAAAGIMSAPWTATQTRAGQHGSALYTGLYETTMNSREEPRGPSFAAQMDRSTTVPLARLNSPADGVTIPWSTSAPVFPPPASENSNPVVGTLPFLADSPARAPPRGNWSPVPSPSYSNTPPPTSNGPTVHFGETTVFGGPLSNTFLPPRSDFAQAGALPIPPPILSNSPHTPSEAPLSTPRWNETVLPENHTPGPNW